MKKHKNRSIKSLALLLSLLVLLTVAVGGTLAYLIAPKQTLENTFAAGSVTCEVIPDASAENTCAVQNTGNVDAYIRVAVVVNWVDGSGNILYSAPAYSVGSGGWELKDGYYCHTAAVSPDGTTASLSVTVTDAPPDGCELQVQFLAEAIQKGGNAAKTAWGEAQIPVGWE